MLLALTNRRACPVLTLLCLATAATLVYRNLMQVAFRLVARVGASVFKRSGRALLSLALAIALLTSSMHHLSCLAEEDNGEAAVVAAASLAQNAPQPADQDQCLPGHCHCVCHADTKVRADAVSVSITFADAGYSDRVPDLARSCTVGPPFEPPCA